jgi:hypothetical protein
MIHMLDSKLIVSNIVTYYVRNFYVSHIVFAS